MAAYALQLPKFKENDDNGLPLSGGKVYTYENGTTTNKTTYTDAGAGTPNSNPVILNSRGEADIWLDGTYTVVLKDSNDVQIYSVDNVTGIGSTSDVIDQWVLSGLTPTYVSATSFTLPGDQTGEFEVGRRIKTTNSGGTVYSTIVSSPYTTLTTVTTVNDASASLDSGLSSVSLGILSTTSQGFPYKERMLKLATTHNITADESYTLTATQNIYGRIIITDTGPLLTGAVNIVVNTDERDFIAQNDTAYPLTFKTSSGTGIAVPSGVALPLVCDGTNVVLGCYSSKLDTVQATTSGTSVTLSPPAWAKKITLSLDQVTTTAANLVLQLGTGGAAETTGYVGTYSRISTQPAYVAASSGATAFFVMASTSGTPVITGTIDITLLDPSTNTWAYSCNMSQYNGTYYYDFHSNGSKSLAGTLDYIKLSNVTFSAGKINALYQ